MKTADEVAAEIVGPNIEGNKYHRAKIKLVAGALTAYAEERVKEEKAILDEWWARASEKTGKAMRAEALEEAAKLVQSFKWSTDDDSELTELLAVKIRALKANK